MPINIPLTLIGGSSEHPSQDYDYQRCVNWFPSMATRDGRGGAGALLPTPGLLELVDLSGDEVRAVMAANDKIYAIVDNTVYKLEFNTARTSMTSSSVGTINTSEGDISWDYNPTQIMIVDGSEDGYIITTATDTLTTISDSDFTGGTQVVFLDSYFFYNTPDASTLYATNINDGSSVDALDVTTAEARPDKTVGLAVDKRELWVFGEQSVEIWYNAANPTGFPLSRREGAFVDQGCAAAGSIANFDNTIVWLDDRGLVVGAVGYQLKVLSDETVSAAIQSYDTISDAKAFVQNDRGHLFYILTFPTAEKTWVLDGMTGLWHERAYWDGSEFKQHLMNCSAQENNDYIVGARNSGKVFKVDKDTYKDGSELIHRLRTSPHFHLNFDQVGIDELELHVEAGTALASGTGSDPEIMMRYSNDGGYTWSSELARSIGTQGQYDKRVRWNRLGTGREWIFEFRMSSPIDMSIVDANMRISPGDA